VWVAFVFYKRPLYSPGLVRLFLAGWDSGIEPGIAAECAFWCFECSPGERTSHHAAFRIAIHVLRSLFDIEHEERAQNNHQYGP